MFIQFKKALLLSIIVFTTMHAGAQDKSAARKQQFNIGSDAVAVKGYDPVAYFIQQKSVKGKKEWAVSHQGVIYYFSSTENKELFKKNPGVYEPQYGGWCAYAMGASAEKIPIDPETFKIVNGKLFLFYNKFFNNTLIKWNKDEQHLHTNADANWIKLFK